MKTEKNYYQEISYLFNSVDSNYERPFYRMTEWGYSEKQIELVCALDYKITALSETVDDVGLVIKPEHRKQAELLIMDCARKCCSC